MKRVLRGIVVFSFISLFLGLSRSEVSGQGEPPKKVSQKSNREAALDSVEAILNFEDAVFLEKIAAAKHPFEPEVVETVQPADKIVRPDIKPTTVRPAGRLPPEAVLRSVAKRLKPKGSLVTSRRSVLLLANGVRLTVGDVLPVRIRGETYNIEVSSITERDYTLSLKGVEVTKNFIDMKQGGSMSFDRK